MIQRYLAPTLLFSGVVLLGYSGFQYGAMLYGQRRLQTLWREQQEVHSGAEQPTPVASLTRISIPSIQFSAVIVEGTDVHSLVLGPGHMSGTAQPGEPGNAVVSAHRDTFFRNILNLAPGDRILIERGGQSFMYAVEQFKIVQPNDISVAAPTADNRLTLVTCDPAYYPGPAPQRLVVISKLVAPESSAPSVARVQAKRTAISKASRTAQ